jgi:hypothetical protein
LFLFVLKKKEFALIQAYEQQPLNPARKISNLEEDIRKVRILVHSTNRGETVTSQKETVSVNMHQELPVIVAKSNCLRTVDTAGL